MGQYQKFYLKRGYLGSLSNATCVSSIVPPMGPSDWLRKTQHGYVAEPIWSREAENSPEIEINIPLLYMSQLPLQSAAE